MRVEIPSVGEGHFLCVLQRKRIRNQGVERIHLDRESWPPWVKERTSINRVEAFCENWESSQFGTEGQSRILNEMSEWFTDKVEAEVRWSVRQQAIRHGLMSQWVSVSQFLLVSVRDGNVETK